jgi:hypothetical protein
MTSDLLRLRDWLKTWHVTHVALEATGVFCKPIGNLLDDFFTRLLVNPRELKQVPGRTSDVRDCQWIASLLQCGLLRSSLVPPRWQRELCDGTRHRAQLLGEHTRTANRIHKVLEDANLKLGAVASDILGKSGRNRLRALLAGEQHPETLAELAEACCARSCPRRAWLCKAGLPHTTRFWSSRCWHTSTTWTASWRPSAPAAIRVGVRT